MKQDTYRVTKERALGDRGGSLDLAQASMVRIDPPLPSPHTTQKVEYRATLEDGDPCSGIHQDSLSTADTRERPYCHHYGDSR